MNSELIVSVARRVKRAILPLLQNREIEGIAKSGDITYRIDKVAEESISSFLKGLDIAYYSEDRGLVCFGKPKKLLIIDPVNGTRSAKSGFESCAISVALTDYKVDAKMRDVECGCILEIKSDRLFLAVRGGGTQIFEEGKWREPNLSKNKDLTSAPLSIEVVGRPIMYIINILENLIDSTSLKGGVFLFHSVCYSITRILTGQLDAYIDIGSRVYESFNDSRSQFKKVGLGRVIAIFPYDIAASLLIAKEAGCIITDAYGGDLGDVELLTNEPQSCIAASNKELHDEILKEVNKKFGFSLIQ